MGNPLTRLRIRALELRAITEEGPYGIILQFPDGLVVLRGENSAGKSTCLTAILYALGLEGMLVKTLDSPFPESMTRRLESGSRTIPVIESYVQLEFSGPDDQVLTTRRSVTGSDEVRQVVTVFSGPGITTPLAEDVQRNDYFVRVPGAAQSDSGFHFFLAKFLHLELPRVARFDGPPVPLYLETLFPFLFVDQIRGWAGLTSRLPTHFRIVDLWTSAVEFLLSLDIQSNALKRHELDSETERIRSQWTQTLEGLGFNARGLGFVPQNLPSEPTAVWPLTPTPRLSVTEGDSWQSLEQALAARTRRLAELQQRDIPRIEQVASGLREAVTQAEAELDRLEAGLRELVEDIELEAGQNESLQTRLRALHEDHRKYRDERRLRDRGAPGNLRLVQNTCPTCKQPLKDVLLPQDSPVEPMSLDDNLRFIEGQIGLFEQMREASAELLRAKQQRAHAMKQKIADQAVVLRDRKRSFRGDAEAPSTAAIRETLLEEDRISRLQELQTRFAEFVEKFRILSTQWRANQSALKSLMRTGLSEADRAKLREIEQLIVAQLREYEFRSWNPDTVQLSDQTYRPVREGLDLPSPVQLSASDGIRVIWAYLVALLETARRHKTNHPGLIVFDEPQQQHMKEISFAALVKRLGPCGQHGQQAIIATSEKRASLDGMLSGVQASVIELPDRALQPLPVVTTHPEAPPPPSAPPADLPK